MRCSFGENQLAFDVTPEGQRGWPSSGNWMSDSKIRQAPGSRTRHQVG